MSCILALNQTPVDSCFLNYEKNASKIDFFSGAKNESPLSIEQREEFEACMNEIRQKGVPILLCFSHDAEFIYVLSEKRCEDK